MNTQECSACEQHQLNNTSFACPSCGHFSFISTVDVDYTGSQADYSMDEDEIREERMSDAFERAQEDYQLERYN